MLVLMVVLMVLYLSLTPVRTICYEKYDFYSDIVIEIPSGHIVNTINIPFVNFFNSETKTLKNKDQIQLSELVRKYI